MEEVGFRKRSRSSVLLLGQVDGHRSPSAAQSAFLGQCLRYGCAEVPSFRRWTLTFALISKFSLLCDSGSKNTAEELILLPWRPLLWRMLEQMLGMILTVNCKHRETILWNKSSLRRASMSSSFWRKHS